MSEFITVDVKVDEVALEHTITELIDDKVMLEIHNLFAKMCDPYVPFLEGPLSQSGAAHVTKDFVAYGDAGLAIRGEHAGETLPVPYARYQYYGKDFNFTKDYHPKATAFWDKVMMQERGQEFTAQVEEILKRRAKELYG